MKFLILPLALLIQTNAFAESNLKTLLKLKFGRASKVAEASKSVSAPTGITVAETESKVPEPIKLVPDTRTEFGTETVKLVPDTRTEFGTEAVKLVPDTRTEFGPIDSGVVNADSGNKVPEAIKVIPDTRIEIGLSDSSSVVNADSGNKAPEAINVNPDTRAEFGRSDIEKINETVNSAIKRAEDMRKRIEAFNIQFRNSIRDSLASLNKSEPLNAVEKEAPSPKTFVQETVAVKQIADIKRSSASAVGQ